MTSPLQSCPVTFHAMSMKEALNMRGQTRAMNTVVLSSLWILTPVSFSSFYVNLRFSFCLLLTFNLGNKSSYTGEQCSWIYPNRNQLTCLSLVMVLQDPSGVQYYGDSHTPFFLVSISILYLCNESA